MVVPKPDGDIRICVDMRRANYAIMRVMHPILTTEGVLQDRVQQTGPQIGIPPRGTGGGVTGSNYIRDTPRLV